MLMNGLSEGCSKPSQLAGPRGCVYADEHFSPRDCRILDEFLLELRRTTPAAGGGGAELDGKE